MPNTQRRKKQEGRRKKEEGLQSLECIHLIAIRVFEVFRKPDELGVRVWGLKGCFSEIEFLMVSFCIIENWKGRLGGKNPPLFPPFFSFTFSIFLFHYTHIYIHLFKRWKVRLLFFLLVLFSIRVKLLYSSHFYL